MATGVTTDSSDFRAYLKPLPDQKACERVLGENIGTNLMQPLYSTGGLLFPYTPTILQFGGNANYDDYHLTHSNYRQPVYKNSEIRDITLSAKFTAQTEFEARYVLAMMKMFSNVTKMTFGERDSKDFNEDASGDAGLPPPVLLFNYLGTHMFYDTPVVVSTYGYDLPEDVDYVKVTIGEFGNEETAYIPAELTLTLELKPYYNPKSLRRNFKLSDFASGELIRGKYFGRGNDYGSGYL